MVAEIADANSLKVAAIGALIVASMTHKCRMDGVVVDAGKRRATCASSREQSGPLRVSIMFEQARRIGNVRSHGFLPGRRGQPH